MSADFPTSAGSPTSDSPNTGPSSTDPLSTDPLSTDVQHLASQSRYLFLQDGRQVGLTDYQLRGNAMHIVHTEIAPELRGNGLGARMVRGVLEQIRVETDYRVVADCPFVADWLSEHPEYQELTRRGQ